MPARVDGDDVMVLAKALHERGEARAIVAKPKVILADEPTGNLDSANGEEVMKLLSQLNEEGTTIVMVTHSPYDANYAHRIVNLFDGKVVTENIKEHFHI